MMASKTILPEWLRSMEYTLRRGTPGEGEEAGGETTSSSSEGTALSGVMCRMSFVTRPCWDAFLSVNEFIDHKFEKAGDMHVQH